MRRLDESLTRLAERGERVGADLLIERVEQRLELGSGPVVVALDPRRTDMQTQQDTAATRQRTRGPWLAAAAFGVAIVIAAAAIVVLQVTNEETLVAGQPPGPLEDFVAAVQAGDTEAALALRGDSIDFNPGFLPWLIALDTSGVEFHECALNDLERVVCRTAFGPNWFYSRIAGTNLESTFSARIEDGKLHGPTWPDPPELAAAEAEFQAWVEATHPERYDEMFSETSFVAQIRFSETSGATRMELLEEFLASR